MYWSIPKVWEGERVAVLCSGPSLTAEDAALVADYPRIVTNATYRMVPDADIVYGSDVFFWRHEEYADVYEHPGLKVSVEQLRGVTPFVPDGILVLRNDGFEGFCDRQDAIKTGGNSGYAAIHIAASAGAKEIVVLGLDMQGTHWHGKHPHGLNNPREQSFVRWMRRFKLLATELDRRGVKVWNCSPVSALEAFEKCPLADL